MVHKFKKNKLAFSMIELIFIIVSVGIFAAVAMPRLLGTGDDAIQQHYIKVRKEANLVWEEYKKQNPYSAVTIESLVETGIFAVGFVSLPETGAIEAILYVAKNISGVSPKKILTKTEKLLPSTENSIILYKTKKIHFIATKAAYEQYLLKDGTQIIFRNTKVIQRDHIFNYTNKNKQLMINGQAPKGIDNQPVQLHHMQQNRRGTLVEVLAKDEHQAYSKHLHSDRTKSEIDRKKFNLFRRSYWKKRAHDMKEI